MIREAVLAALEKYNRLKPPEKFLSTVDGYFFVDVVDGAPILKVRIGDYEFTQPFQLTTFTGETANFVAVDMSDDGWTLHGAELFDGESYLERGAIELGGQDFTIDGTAFESAENMFVRRKIFELYTSGALNLSLYSSGAGKNLDLLVNCGGEFDNFSKPAILEREFRFSLVWRQVDKILRLFVDGEKIYTIEGCGFDVRRTFEQARLGAGILHADSFWRGTITSFKIYDGLALFC